MSIEHCVFLQVQADKADLFEPAMVDLGAVVAQIEGASDLRYGPNEDYEQSTTAFTHGFIVRFDGTPSHKAYLDDPEHLQVASRLIAMTIGGKAGISVFDLTTD